MKQDRSDKERPLPWPEANFATAYIPQDEGDPPLNAVYPEAIGAIVLRPRLTTPPAE